MIIFQSVSNGQDHAQEIIDQFFEEYFVSPDDAIYNAFATNKWMMEDSRDAIDNVVFQLKNFIDLIGNYNGFEKIREKDLTTSLKFYTYLVKYERQPLRFTFLLYKPSEKWQLQNFKFDDSIDDDIEASAKDY